jgi:uncharacterized tellurite resistance protein B-like protein
MENNTFQEKFVKIIIPLFEGTIEDRKNHYLENPKPEKEQIENIINTCSTTNGTISGISGMLPGPAGLIAIIPELKSTLENQIVMIYDIGVAHGKEEQMSKEMVLALAMQSGLGSIGINALARQGEKILIKKASVKVFQQLAKIMGIRLTAGVIKSAVAKFVPVLGGLAIGVWVKYTTTEMGENTAVILSKKIDIKETDQFDEYQLDPEETLEILENKVIILMNLMKADGDSKDKEKEYIKQIIENIDFSYFTTAKLRVDLELSSQSEVDFLLLNKASKSDKDSLLIDMISLAKRDGEVHAKEFEYIMQVCEKLNLDAKFVINELGANYLAVKYYLKDLAIETNGVIIVSFNNSLNKAQFYNNNRVFISDQNNNILKKGSYLIGGRKIVLDSGTHLESNIVIENLIKTVL